MELWNRIRGKLVDLFFKKMVSFVLRKFKRNVENLNQSDNIMDKKEIIKKGKWAGFIAILIPAVMLKLGSLGIEAANVYFIGSRQYEPKDVASNSLLSSILLGVILIFLFLGISYLSVFRNFLNSNQINIFYLWLVVLTIPFSLLSGFLKNIFLGKEEIITFNKINIFQTIIKLVLIVIFLMILKQGVSGAVNVYILTVMFVFVFIIFLTKKSLK